MMFHLVCLILGLSAALGAQFPGAKERASGWVLDNESSGAMNPSTVLSLRLPLHPRNPAELTRLVHSIAQPGSKDFRKYLTNREITELVGVDDAELEKVTSYLTAAGFSIEEVPPNRDWISVKAPIAAIEKALETKLATWTNVNGQTKIGAISSYTIPPQLDLVQFVPGLTSFSFGSWRPIVQPFTESKDAEAPALGPAAVTPQSIYDTYGTDVTDVRGSRLGSQAVIEYGKLANFNEADLQTFFDQLAPNLSGETCGTSYGVNNGDIKGSVEANLDVQYMMVVGQHVNTSTYKIAETGVNIEDQMLDYAYIVGNQTDPPLVHSISYGEYGGSYDNNTVQRFNYELQKMAARGITVMLASGDNGVGCNTAGTEQEFDFPSSPYITMVGATYLDAASGQEIGATLSSGGFSKDYYRPSWQDAAVASYFASPEYKAHSPSEDFYADGRAYPDVAAFGQNVQVVSAGKASGVSGTSCSAPIFAGVIALLNHELLSAGKAPMGWINPWIYANPQMFTDVTEGSNPYQKCDGFVASKGWDPVTGMGTPVYPEMLKAALAQ